MALLVRDIMTDQVSSVTPDTPLTDVAREIIDMRYSGVPVVKEDGSLVGVVEVEDLLPRPSQVPFTRVPVLEFQEEWIDEHALDRFMERLQELTVEHVMRSKFATVHADTSVGDVLSKLLSGQARRLMVVDDDGRLVGVITRTDLLRAFTRGP